MRAENDPSAHNLHNLENINMAYSLEETAQQSMSRITDRWNYNCPDSELEAKTFQWIESNQDAFIAMIDLADDAYLNKGYQRWSIAGLVEIIRWDRPDVETSKGGFRLSNSYRAYIARLINEYLGHSLFVVRNNEGRIHDYE